MPRLSQLTIKIVADISADLEKKRETDLELYEQTHDVMVNYRQFSLILSDADNQPLGILKAYTAFAEIYIDDIWVDSQHRKKNYGKMLMEHLENHFKNKGFNNINLVTSEFQAPEFYQKCGYQLEFIRKNVLHPKFNKYFFVKFFKNTKQTQGCVK